MAHYKAEDEAPSERLVLIVLESRDKNDNTYRHLRASVVRRAMSHQVSLTSTTYYDDRVATGYRNASWSSAKSSAVYVADLYVRGQMSKTNILYDNDNTPSIAQPYGNEVVFQPHLVTHRDAMNMANTYKNFDKQVNNLTKKGIEFSNTFEGQCTRLAIMLNIKTFLFNEAPDRLAPCLNANLSQTGYYQEATHQDMKWKLSKLIKKASDTLQEPVC